MSDKGGIITQPFWTTAHFWAVVGMAASLSWLIYTEANPAAGVVFALFMAIIILPAGLLEVT
jgi:uncharacterized membrane protein